MIPHVSLDGLVDAHRRAQTRRTLTLAWLIVVGVLLASECGDIDYASASDGGSAAAETYPSGITKFHRVPWRP